MRQAKRGWIFEDTKYGTWFVSREDVITDWKEDHRVYYNEECDPSEDEIQVWANEQIKWPEVYHYGYQISGPDMNYWRNLFIREMKSDTEDCANIQEIK